MYANIIIDITHEKLDRVFQYKIPDELADSLEVGMQVHIPFGKGNRMIQGYVVGFSENPDYDPEKVKEIQSIAKEGMAIEGQLTALAAWIKERYGGTMIQALKTVLPIKKKEKEKEKRYIRLLLSEQEGEEKLLFYEKKNQKARKRLLEALLKDPVIEYTLVVKKLNITASVIKALEEQKVLGIETERVFRNPTIKTEQKEEQKIYTKEQDQAIRHFLADYTQGIRKTYLIHGVTGSGKTEVYMEMIAEVLKEGKEAIVLIPEIALTYQTVMRFYRRFGEQVSILNSRMSPGERYDQMMRAKAGEVKIVIGPRSALFTPFQNLGIILIDEEHETTYKSEQVPRYHARETAIKRAELANASVVLGSATPSLEAYYRAEKGEYTLLELGNRVENKPLPEVKMVDLREELKKGNRSILSQSLQEAIQERLEKGQQTILFLNRRGFAGFLCCRSCGHVEKCPHCDVSLSLHNNGKLVCHYCGYEKKENRTCEQCGSPHIGAFRVGTQQVEEIVKRTFPNAGVLRMDLDTTKGKEGHEKILAAFANQEADILIGTQMIVKGHDFPHVTLVGILAADLSLYADDFRAGERTFQLLTQAAGRAGRGTEKGEVIIQTYSPDHYSIVHASMQDYIGFYREEISYRDLMGYPPVDQMLAILMADADADRLETGAAYLRKYIERIDPNHILTIIGPATPYLGKVHDIYRKIIYLKCEDYDMLVKAKNRLEQYIEVNAGFNKMHIQFDFNPMNIF